MSTACVLVGGGQGVRLGADVPKAFALLSGRTLLAHALDAVARCGEVDLAVAVVPPGYAASAARALPPYGHLPTYVVEGGVLRHDSVAAGLAALPEDVDVVLVHDAARPLAPPELFATVARTVRTGVDAVVPGVPVTDTVKEVDRAGWVRTTPDRTKLRAVQTPQGFRRSVLVEAHAAAGRAEATDDAALVERLGRSVLVVPGAAEAFKVTAPLDLVLAEAMLRAAR